MENDLDNFPTALEHPYRSVVRDMRMYTGTMPPFAHANPGVQVLVDSQLEALYLAHGNLLCGSGASNAIVSLSFQELLLVSGGKVADIKLETQNDAPECDVSEDVRLSSCPDTKELPNSQVRDHHSDKGEQSEGVHQSYLITEIKLKQFMICIHTSVCSGQADAGYNAGSTLQMAACTWSRHGDCAPRDSTRLHSYVV